MTDDLVVLDASALLALLFNEAGADLVAARLATSVIGAVNLSEVAAKLADHGMPQAAIALTFGEFDLDVRPFDVDQARCVGQRGHWACRWATAPAWRSRMNSRRSRSPQIVIGQSSGLTGFGCG